MFHLSAASRQDVPSFGKESCVCMCVCMCIVCATFVLSRCPIFWLGKLCLHVAMCVCVQLSCCQDVPSFSSYSSRCSIFWRSKLFACMCVCMCILCVTFVLSRCSIFRQVLVKMFHLSAREVVFAWCVCMCIVCVTFVLSRCFIFRQLLIKMFHLSARKVVCMYVCVCMCIVCANSMLSRCSIFLQFLVKMSCFGSFLSRYPFFDEEGCVLQSVHVYCLSCCKMFQCVYASFCSRGSVILLCLGNNHVCMYF